MVEGARYGGSVMTSTRSLVLVLVFITLIGCRDSNPPAVAPTSQNVNGKKGRIQGVTANVRQRGPGLSPYAFDVSPPNLNWPQFRGDHGRSVAERDDLAKSWSDDDGIYWKSELSGRGASSPVIYGNHVYLTSASGYGESESEPGSVDDLTYHLTCFSRKSGMIQWQRDVKGSPLTQPLTPEIIRNGLASNSPVADGHMVFAFFGASGVFAFDDDGKLLWHANVGNGQSPRGSGASLIRYKRLLIVNASVESQAVYAFDADTGDGVWKIDGIDESSVTPVVDKNKNGKDELVIVEKDFVRGFDPETGKELWHCEGIHDDVVATPFVRFGICFCNGGSENQLMAIKLGGRGDVTKTHKLWEVSGGSKSNSLTYVNGYLYVVSDDNELQCFNARDGEFVSQLKLPAAVRTFSTTLLADKCLYVPVGEKGVLVVAANSEMSKVSHNEFATDATAISSSLSVGEAALFVRSERYLYRISEREDSYVTVNLADSEIQAETIEPQAPHAWDEEANQRRAYAKFLADDLELVAKAIIAPLESKIEDAQRDKAKNLAADAFTELQKLAQQARDARWNYLKFSARYFKPQIADEALDAELDHIEQEVNSIVDATRKSIETELAKEG